MKEYKLYETCSSGDGTAIEVLFITSDNQISINISDEKGEDERCVFLDKEKAQNVLQILKTEINKIKI